MGSPSPMNTAESAKVKRVYGSELQTSKEKKKSSKGLRKTRCEAREIIKGPRNTGERIYLKYGKIEKQKGNEKK